MEKKNTITMMIVLVIILGLVAAIVLLVIDNRQKQAQLDAIVSERVNAVDAVEADAGVTSPKEGDPESGTGSDAEILCTQEFFSEKGVTVRLHDWTASKTISSPVTITGEIPGSWSFEGSFPVVLVNWDGLIIAEQPAILQGDWMTEDYVPFAVTLSFDTPSTYMNGALILQKDNPSGLSENDDAIEIPVTFE